MPYISILISPEDDQRGLKTESLSLQSIYIYIYIQYAHKVFDIYQRQKSDSPFRRPGIQISHAFSTKKIQAIDHIWLSKIEQNNTKFGFP